MSEAKKYTGGCHCKSVRYEVTAEFKSVMSCNCSMCSKKGHLLAFVAPDQFVLLSGEDGLTDYQFHKHVIHHPFCKVCGVSSFMRGTSPRGPMVAINTRCIDDLDLA